MSTLWREFLGVRLDGGGGGRKETDERSEMGLKLLGASAWSRLTVMEGVRCGRQEHLARGSLKTRQAGEFLWIISRKCDVFEKAKLKSH
jgi:hypothetical protein